MATFSGGSVQGPGVEMLYSLFTTFAVGLAVFVFLLTIVIPLVLGYFDRRELP